MLMALASCSTVNLAEDLTTIGHSKSHGDVIDCAVDGGSRILILQREGRVTKLLTFSEFNVLVEDKIVEPTSYFLRSIGQDILVGSVRDNKTLLSTSKHAWTLPGFLSDVQTYRQDGNVFAVGILAHVGERKTGSAAWKMVAESSAAPISIALDPSVKPKQMFSSQRAVYAIAAAGLYRLRLGDVQPDFELLVKGKFNIGSAASPGEMELAAVVATKMMVQNEVELRSLPDGKIIQTLKYPYSVVSVSMAGANDGHALILVKSKESLAQAELVLLDKTGRLSQRNPVDYWSRLAANSRPGRFALVNPDELVEVNLK